MERPRSFAPTLTKRLASSAIVDSIDLMPNPKPLNKFNVNALCSFHGCAAANPVPRIKDYFVFAITETVINKYIPKVNLFPLLRFVPGDVFRVQQCTDQNQMVREGIQKSLGFICYCRFHRPLAKSKTS
jgi:hypothetical protein